MNWQEDKLQKSLEALRLNKITSLNLKVNNLGVEGSKLLVEALETNTTLEKLDLGTNNLGNEGIQILSKNLLKNSLRELNLSWNNIGVEGSKCLSAILKNNVFLQDLDLSNNSFGEEGTLILSKSLAVNYSLQKLDLENNKIGNKGASALNDALKVNYSLQKINLSHNSIANNILDEITMKLKRNESSFFMLSNKQFEWKNLLEKKEFLKVLILRNCELIQVPDVLLQLSSLVHLDLQENFLSEISDFSKLVDLYTLNLSKNKISLNIQEGNTCSQLSFFVSKLPSKLNRLLLYENESVPKTLQTFSFGNMIHLFAHSNFLENELPFLSEIFFWIMHVNNVEFSSDKLLSMTKTLKQLKILDLRSSNLSTIPKESPIYKLEHFCTQLILINNQFTEVPEAIFSLSELRTLRLENNAISSIPDSVSKLKSLLEISLDENKFYEFPISLTKVKTIERIWIDKNRISSVPTNFPFFNIQRLSISHNILSNFGGIIEWNTLQVLLINDNFLTVIPKEIKNLNHLKKFHLNQNKIHYISPELGQLLELKALELRNNLIEEIPVHIGELINLESLDFSNNNIKYLPSSMGLLNKLINLNFGGNPIISPPIQFTNNLKDLKGYWKDLLMGEEKCNYLKLIILGEENVGKTTLIKTLNAYNTLNFGSRESMIFKSSSLIKKPVIEKTFKEIPLSTDGIDISVHPLVLNVDKSYSLPNNQLIFNIWDFGGQEVYYSTHIFFISPNSIYLIAWNMGKKDEELNRLIYWVQTIKSYIKDPIIILVGTHLDCIDTKSNKSIEEIYEYVSNKTGIPRNSILGVSCKTGKNYRKLIQLLKNKVFNEEVSEPHQTSSVPTNPTAVTLSLPVPPSNAKTLKSMVGEIFPKMYFDLKKIIDEEGKRRVDSNLPPILEWKEFISISKKSNIVGEELKRALIFLHCLGFCLYFANDKTLSKFVVLHSQWLADTMATLVTTRGMFVKKGLLDHQHFKQVWREPKYPEKIHPILIELLQKFQVLIPITHDIDGDIYSGKSVVPALLSIETKPILIGKWNDSEKIRLQRIYQFNSFLPTQIFPQFLATIFSLIGLRSVKYWRDGVLIIKENVRCLIEYDSVEQYIMFSLTGKNFFYLFKQIQITLEMVLNKWENLSMEIYVTCPICSSSLFPSNRNKCFKLRECFNVSSNKVKYVKCENASKERLEAKVQTKLLIPELDSSQIERIEWGDIELGDKIGEGTFAQVYKGKYDNKYVAVKKLKIEQKPREGEQFIIDEDSLRDFLLEIEFSSYGKHPNILQFTGIVFSPPAIILPFATYGSLFKILHQDSSINEIRDFELILRIGLDISLGLNYLHSLEPPIMHCDLKSENILMMSLDYKDTTCVCKVSDFGLSQFSVGRFLINQNVNPRWTAPEVIEKKDQSPYSDIYSFGIILYELLTRKIPYSKEEVPEWKFMQNVEKAIIDGIRPSYSKQTIESDFKTEIPNQIYEILESCWNKHPVHRPRFRLIGKTLYSLLSVYWDEIDQFIQIPRPNIESSLFSDAHIINEIEEIENKNIIEFKSQRYFKKQSLLYSGTYSILSTCKIEDLEGEYVLKEMKMDCTSEEKKKKLSIYFKVKLDIMKSLTARGIHPHLVRLVGYYINISENKFWIIMDYYDGGNLEQFLTTKFFVSKDLFSLAELKQMSREILSGLKYLHDNGYSHLDLRPQNILIKREEINKILSLHLCDFGTIKIQNRLQLELKASEYVSPESISNTKSCDGTKADIWSFGLIVFRMMGEKFSREGPFKTPPILPLDRDWVPLQPFPEIYSKCTQIDPLSRISVNELLTLITK